VAEVAEAMPTVRAALMSRIPFDKWALIGNRARAIAKEHVTDADLAAFVARYQLGEPVSA